MNKLFLWCLCLLVPFFSFGQNFASFTQVGPVKFPANPSVQTTGMGRVSYLAYHPTDSNTMFAVTASGGVFKTSNEGVTWKPMSDFLPQTACASLAINPLNPNVMYLGTGDANYDGGGMGVWKTTDAGNSWFQSTTGIGNKLVSYIRFTPNDTNTLIAACKDGIYKSTNSGVSWVKKTTVNASYRDLHYRPQSNSIIYSATNANFFRSYDNGESWTSSNLNSAITCAGIKIAVCAGDTSKIYCVVWKSGATSPFGGIYKSVNNGTTFTLQADTPNVLGYSGNGSSLDGQGAYNLAIISDPNNVNTIYIAGICVWKSIDEGKTFTLKSHWGYGVHADKHGFLFSPYNPRKLFCYHDGGLDRSIDGGDTWITLEDGLSASEFYKMGSSGLYNDHIIGGLQDNGLDVATNKKFSTVRGGDWGGDFAFDAFDSSIVYENGGIKRNLISHATGNINGQDGIYGVHPKDSNVLFEITTNLFRTTNLRANPSTNVSWTQISNISGNTGPRALAFSKSSYGMFYMAFNSQSFYKTTNINATTPVFTKITTFPFNGGEQIKQLETCDYDSLCIYVLTSQSRIFRSSDRGVTWVNINLNLPASTIIKFLLNQKSTDSSMYACTAFGVYYRTRYISNWISYSQGLPTVATISDMEIMSDGTPKSRLHISTYGRGIWQTDLFRSPTTAPIADFVIQSTSAQKCANTIIVVDNSTASPVTRKWQISPNTGWSYINGTDSFSTRAEIKFSTVGVYFISLTVTNSKGSNTKTINYNYSNLSVAPTCTTTTNLLGGYTIGIYRFELNAINNGSGTGNTSYEDFSCASNTMLIAGATYTAWVTNGNSYGENSKIYIDYNNNGNFTDANELVGTISNGLGRRSCTFTVLQNPPLLNRFLRLRVVSDNATVTSPCGTLGYGQSEDYAVFLDKTRPTISITIPKPEVSNGFTAYFKTSEVVFGFAEADLNMLNATVSNFTQLDIYNYSARITPTNNGKVKLTLNANSFSDLAGNPNNLFADSTNFFLGIKSFKFNGLSTHDTIIQTTTGGAITCRVPFGTVLDSMISSFSLSDSSTAFLNSNMQLSGSTKNNFNSTTNYLIKSSDNSLTKSYTVQVVTAPNKECKLLTYGFTTPAVSATITQLPAGGSVALTIPYGTAVNNLTAWFSLSDSAQAYISSVKQFSNFTSNNFTALVVYKVVAQDTNFSKTYTINITFGKSKSCDLLSYSIQNPFSSGTITTTGNSGGTVSVILPYSTSLSNLISLFVLSDSASAYIGTVKQLSGISINNFTTLVNLKIVANDTNFTKTYLITVTIAKNTEAKILSYNLVTPSSTGTITPTSFGGFINLVVPFGTSLSSLFANFTLSDSANAFVNVTLQQSGITPNNYTDTLMIIVIAHDGISSELYKVIVSVIQNAACDILSFKFNSPNAIGTITPSFNGGTIAVLVPFSTNLTNLIANFSLSDSSKAFVGGILQQSNTNTNDFTGAVTYVVKAQNNINSKTYVVNVSKSTGIDIKTGKEKLKIYPNPATDLLFIEDDNLHFEPTKFKLVNMFGQAILTGETLTKVTQIDLSRFAAGIYYFEVFTNTGTSIMKFVKE